MIQIDNCYLGDCRESMRRMLDEGGAGKVQTIITSPPYWGLRDYGVAGQLGKEPTLREFLDNMVEVFDLCREWTIPTESYSDAHFATFPQALVEPCILAGSRPGDIVFDPFLGSGTVAQVAQRLGRHWVGCELNPEYLEMQRDRTRQRGLL